MGYWIGIDPGMSGGMAAVNEDGATAEKFVSPQLAMSWLEGLDGDSFVNSGIEAVIVERVHSMPKQGVSSTFKFGFNAGQWDGLLTGLGFQPVYVQPAVWQKYMGCRTKGDKRITREAAQKLYPGLKVTHATADALLIATYGSRFYGGTK